MNICCISDTHGYHRSIEIPPGVELLIFAGDISNSGEYATLHDFNLWLGELKQRGIESIVIAGNHDLILEKQDGSSFITNGKYLINSWTNFKGLEIFGSPYAPKVGNWAFGYRRETGNQFWNAIQHPVDILITHGPPFGILDVGGYDMEHLGCAGLHEAVVRVRPKIHIFGHIHEGHGTVTAAGTRFINASICGFPDYSKLSSPIVVSVNNAGVA